MARAVKKRKTILMIFLFLVTGFFIKNISSQEKGADALKTAQLQERIDKSKKEMIFTCYLIYIASVEFGEIIVPSYFFKNSVFAENRDRCYLAIKSCQYQDISSGNLIDDDHRLATKFDNFNEWISIVIENDELFENCDNVVIIDEFSQKKLPYRYYWATTPSKTDRPLRDSLIVSNGPDGIPDIDPLDARFYGETLFIDKIYDPTNGLNSKGDIVIHEDELFDFIGNKNQEREFAIQFKESFCFEKNQN